MSTSALIFYFLVEFIVGVAGVITFDKLVQLEFRNHRESWEQDGRPWNGLTNPPPGVSVFNTAWQRCCLVWLLSTPIWTESDKNASRLLRLYRALALIFNLGLCGGIMYRIFS